MAQASPELIEAAGRRMAAWRAGLRARYRRVPQGIELYQGPSPLGPGNIVVVVTGLVEPSSNRKTGDVLPVYILPTDEPPTVAVVSGSDQSVCGSCRHRPKLGGICYVNTSWGPAAVWRAWKAGLYAAMSPAEATRYLTGADARFGAWGDPAAVSLATWSPLLSSLRAWTGFTHQWRGLDASWHWLMASVDSAAERSEAKALGWRTYRVKAPEDPLLPGERLCLAEEFEIPCSKCRGCDGNGHGVLLDYAIDAHGTAARYLWREHQGNLFGGV